MITLQCGPKTLNQHGKTKYLIMPKYNYNSLWEFLKATPKNMWSVITIWTACILALIVIIEDMESFDSITVVVLAMIFIMCIAFLGWYRVFDLYMTNKKHID